jgi:hypothetical protein
MLAGARLREGGSNGCDVVFRTGVSSALMKYTLPDSIRGAERIRPISVRYLQHPQSDASHRSTLRVCARFPRFRVWQNQ